MTLATLGEMHMGRPTIALALGLCLTACVHVHERLIGSGADGGDRYRITCNRDIGHCYDRAAELCKNGYDLVREGGKDGVVQIGEDSVHCSRNMDDSVDCRENRALRVPTFDGVLVVDCKRDAWAALAEGPTTTGAATLPVRPQETERRAVRAKPKAPELGSTPRESQAICAREGGEITRTQTVAGLREVCRVGGVPIYAAVLSAGESTYGSVQTYYEGADIAAVRKLLETSLGPADRVTIQNGFRVWQWEHADPVVYLQSYPAGVVILARSAGQPAAGDTRDAETTTPAERAASPAPKGPPKIQHVELEDSE